MTDPIADMLTRIRNAVHARHQRVDVPASRFKAEIARILEQEGYIHGFKLLEGRAAAAAGPGTPVAAGNKKAVAEAEATRPVLRLHLKYGPKGETVIGGIERVSRPGRRVYLSRNDVPKVMGGLGTNILTTPQGVMTGQQAVKAGVGGEVLCNVW
jgi:small subunit ribosomal protein S8